MGHDEDKNFNALNELNRISGNTFSAHADSGDIIINSRSATNKKPLLVVIIAMVALLFILVIFLLLRNTGILTGGLPPAYADAYNSYSSYLINGDNNTVSLDDAFKNNKKIYPFTESEGFSRSDNQNMEKYFEELNKRFEELKAKSDPKNDDIQKAIAENEELLNIIEKTANHTKYLKELRQTFDNNQNQVENKINSIFKYEGDDPYLMTAVERQKKFYLLFIKEYALYKNNNCYNNGYYNLECMVQHGQSMQTLRDKSTDVANAYGEMSEDGLTSILSHRILRAVMKMGGKDENIKK